MSTSLTSFVCGASGGNRDITLAFGSIDVCDGKAPGNDSCGGVSCQRGGVGATTAFMQRTSEKMAVFPASDGPTSSRASPLEVDFLRETIATTTKV